VVRWSQRRGIELQGSHVGRQRKEQLKVIEKEIEKLIQVK